MDWNQRGSWALNLTWRNALSPELCKMTDVSLRRAHNEKDDVVIHEK